MKLFCLFLKFHIILLTSKFSFILLSPISKINDDIINLTSYTNIIINSKKKLSNELCAIKNCISCDNRNECIKCKEGYELDKARCYSKNCEIYGFCKFCDEYDCLKCQKGYKLIYGICEQREVSKKKLILIIFGIVALITLIIYICIRYKKLTKVRISTGQIIKFMHPKSGFYQLHYEVKNGMDDVSRNKILSFPLSTSTGDPTIEKSESPIVNRCVVCGSNKVYTMADCGCSICFEHFKIIKKEKNITCRIHHIIMTSSISFKMVEKSNIKGNALEKLGLKKCPICKINDGTQSFNCGCMMKVCEKCFNDNVYVFNYNQCPGCGEPYRPSKNNKKKYKNGNDTVNIKKNKENGGISNGK